MKIPDELAMKLQAMAGQQCSLQRVANDKSLFLGFGEILNSATAPHGAWEIGTYDCSWRIIREGKVLCGRDDTIDDIVELKDAVKRIRMGCFASLSHLSEFDIRITLSCGTKIDFLCTISEDDEVLHVFFPSKEVAVFTAMDGWRLGRSDEAWA